MVAQQGSRHRKPQKKEAKRNALRILISHFESTVDETDNKQRKRRENTGSKERIVRTLKNFRVAWYHIHTQTHNRAHFIFHVLFCMQRFAKTQNAKRSNAATDTACQRVKNPPLATPNAYVGRTGKRIFGKRKYGTGKRAFNKDERHAWEG